ncbi:MAG: beta-lactamase family protein, partial [Planctomycetales bacterium]|nr:beta-lactamase family protein [Planctomycetales bacterium]
AKRRQEHNLVALAAMQMVDGKIVAAAADGERAAGSGVPATSDDQWHLGSITKSITATMIARLVAAGDMSWDETVGDSFRDFAELDDGWRKVTLAQLLTHASGAPANLSPLANLVRPEEGAERTEARRRAAELVLGQPPLGAPGEKFAYSNAGYTIAGVMAEQATGETWENLVRREVFGPLQLASAGFGAPRWGDPLDQPRGHLAGVTPRAPVVGIEDNTPLMGPAGTIHMTLHDLCAFANEHLQGERGKGILLTQEAYRRLHTPVLGDYGYGWVCVPGDEAGTRAHVWHNGSNTMWYALVVLVPDANSVVAVASNDGDIDSAQAAAWQIVEQCCGPLKTKQ